ncbi:hypothetical protein LZ496_12425 [Sphingomonas sp. NSE70-1]|uniref:Uncharacterized protein n=1 Tax=Sphingomonas caseinilyticus TaxID=2908205 RepID=A0ABT0RXY6_9SPHN|nr:hypothetical protein [Sphingomonas caseinilyticus]MCL6699585.1 hypothetical protein [Sphingomonas caseinilyticus]
MSIKSNAFGRVELTGADAKKFRAQATYGRPKAAAKSGAAKGSVMARELQSSGTVKLKLRATA